MRRRFPAPPSIPDDPGDDRSTNRDGRCANNRPRHGCAADLARPPGQQLRRLFDPPARAIDFLTNDVGIHPYTLSFTRRNPSQVRPRSVSLVLGSISSVRS